MEEKKKDEEITKLNEIIFDPDLSVEEIEERLEFVEVWICVTYCSPVGSTAIK